MKIRLRDNVILEYKNNICVVSKLTKEYSIVDDDKIYYELLCKKEWIEEELDEEMYEFLVSENLVVSCYENFYQESLEEKNIWYFESLDMPWNSDFNKIQSEISNANMLIIGCGGVGTVVLQNLIGFGIKNIVLRKH